MQEILDFLKQCETFYVATMENDQPRVRPFGAACVFEGKLYLVTNCQKAVYRQMQENPKIEICGLYDGVWMRIEGQVKLDPRREARVAMLEDNLSLKSMYHADDGLMVVLSVENLIATQYSFTEAPRQIVP